MAGAKSEKSLRGIVRTASPMTPPSPVGKAQRAVAGRNDASPAASTPPMIHKSSRVLTRSSRRVVISRQPQRPGGTMRPMTPSPSICISRSAATAPREPRRLRTGPEVAWLRLGSSTDQDNRASASAIVPARRQKPASSAPRRAAKARKGSGTRASAVMLVVVRIHFTAAVSPACVRRRRIARAAGDGARERRRTGGKLARGG